MISRSFLARSAQQAARRSCNVQRRTFAAAASSTGSYETSDVTGLKVAARDSHGPTTKLAIVAKAGTRFQPLPGLAVGLEEFAFKNTSRRSALRITRESELLGGQLASSHTREAVVLEASFLREDLPYFTELLAEVISLTKYTTHEFHEDIERVLRLKQAALAANVSAIALDNAHAVAFHSGLGSSLYPASSTPFQKYLNEEYIASYADAAYTKPNIALIADGAAPEALSKWVGQFFKDVPATSSSGQSLKTEATKYYGGEQRTSHTAGNSIVIAFPGSSYTAPKAEIAVLASLLGGQSSIKWAPGFSLISKAAAGTHGLSASTANLTYSDAGLLTIQLSGSAAGVRKGAEETVKALKSIAEGSVAKEDVAKAIASAKFEALDQSQTRSISLLLAGSGLVNGGKVFEPASLAESIGAVTAEKLKTTAKALLDGKATVSTVGDLFVLPYAEELGLKRYSRKPHCVSGPIASAVPRQRPVKALKAPGQPRASTPATPHRPLPGPIWNFHWDISWDIPSVLGSDPFVLLVGALEVDTHCAAGAPPQRCGVPATCVLRPLVPLTAVASGHHTSFSLARPERQGRENKASSPPPQPNLISLLRIQIPPPRAPVAHCEAIVAASSWTTRARISSSDPVARPPTPADPPDPRGEPPPSAFQQAITSSPSSPSSPSSSRPADALGARFPNAPALSCAVMRRAGP
ncbi:hypothetical protein G7046_g1408 [Stylonectria norvegica]|nr:hypothetical protein G7046_g1408 [Stylonectria norvegica]